MVCRMAQITVVNQKLNALADAVDQAYDKDEIDVDEILRLATDLRREASTPIFVQKFKRDKGRSGGHVSAESYRPATF